MVIMKDRESKRRSWKACLGKRESELGGWEDSSKLKEKKKLQKHLAVGDKIFITSLFQVRISLR